MPAGRHEVSATLHTDAHPPKAYEQTFALSVTFRTLGKLCRVRFPPPPQFDGANESTYGFDAFQASSTVVLDGKPIIEAGRLLV